jgi:predicted enzyme related to lactoylglutathione lyase
MRRIFGSTLTVALMAVAAAAIAAGVPGTGGVVAGDEEVVSSTAGARPCVIRCSDLTGCQKCCVQQGGWVCEPV